MARFGADPRRFFESVYEGVAPWDIGAPQPGLVELFDSFPLQAPVLDLGSGPGDLAIWIARQGLDVVGIEFVAAAVAESQRRAGALADDVRARLEFRSGDALHPSRLGRRFASVVDSGFYHLFEIEQAARLVGEIGRVLCAGGRYYVLAFSVDLPSPDVPRGVTEDELRRLFTARGGWRVLEISGTEFVSRLGTVPAVRGCFERRD